MRKMRKKNLIMLVLMIILISCSSYSLKLSNSFTSYIDMGKENFLSKGFNTNTSLLLEKTLSDSFQLITNNPLITKNTTHLTIANLTITFTNGTDIVQASGTDNVTLIIYNNYDFSQNYTMQYSTGYYSGWGVHAAGQFEGKTEIVGHRLRRDLLDEPQAGLRGG